MPKQEDKLPPKDQIKIPPRSRDGQTFKTDNELPEREICNFYLQTKSLSATVDYFQHDRETIKRVLYKHNILNDDIIQQIKDYHKSKPVAQIDIKTNQILNIYPSVSAAQRAIGGNNHINAVCMGKRNSAAGFKWKYVQDLKE